jgi:hypothetical protein
MRWVVIAVVLSTVAAQASERRFTFAYDTDVMPKGASELELWATPHFGHADDSTEIENRVELEWGLGHQLQTSLYLNLVSAFDGSPKTADLEWSVSNEWKLKLLDSAADAFGLGVYGELELGYHEAELEAKVLLDKRVGQLLATINFVGAQEWEFTPGAPNRDTKVEADAGAAWFFSPSFSVGIEARSHGVFSSDEGFEGNAFYAGPVATWASRTFWASLSVMPQLAAVKPESEALSDSRLDLGEHERLMVRLLVGFDL